MIYAVLQTPPGTTLDVTNDVAKQLQARVREVEGVESITSLAGYEALTEGRGSNAGTCLINLESWSKRKHSMAELIEELFNSARADYVEVLLTRREALEAQIESIEAKKQQLRAAVGFYRALGGGWR
jgi:multidrug efflux pump subunit AcrB